MIAQLAQIWRHPIKGIGTEELDSVRITPERPLPLDRAWAVLQEGGDAKEGWRRCTNFLRGAKGPSLMAVTARTEMASHTLGPSDGTVMVTAPTTRLRLNHPDRPEILIDPARDGPRLIDWITPIYPKSRPAPLKLVRAPNTGMADVPFGSISILSLASLRALNEKVGQRLDPRRFRGNLWIEGWEPWREFDLTDRVISIGGVDFEIVGPITRCRATEADPDSGKPDAAILRTLEEVWGHRDFGVYARALTHGTIERGAAVRIAE